MRSDEKARRVTLPSCYLLILNLSYIEKLKISPSGLLALFFFTTQSPSHQEMTRVKSSKVNIKSPQKLESSPTKAGITAENGSETESTDM